MSKLPKFDPTEERHFVIETSEDLDADYYERTILAGEADLILQVAEALASSNNTQN